MNKENKNKEYVMLITKYDASYTISKLLQYEPDNPKVQKIISKLEKVVNFEW